MEHPTERVFVDHSDKAEDGEVSDSDTDEEGVEIFLTVTELEEIARGVFDWERFISDAKNFAQSASGPAPKRLKRTRVD